MTACAPCLDRAAPRLEALAPSLARRRWRLGTAGLPERPKSKLVDPVPLLRAVFEGCLRRVARGSASAISQAERGPRGLPLETVLELSTGLNVTLDELLCGEAASGYESASRPD